MTRASETSKIEPEIRSAATIFRAPEELIEAIMKIGDTNIVFSLSNSKNKSQPSGTSSFEDVINSVGSTASDGQVPDDIAGSQGAKGGLSVSGENGDAHRQELVNELHKWANMNPAEMIRAKYLAAHNLSDDSLTQLSPELRQQIEDEIRKQVEEQAKQQASSANEAMSALAL